MRGRQLCARRQTKALRAQPGSGPVVPAPVPGKDDAATAPTTSGSSSTEGRETPGTGLDAGPSSPIFGGMDGVVTADGDGYTSLELATATSFIEKVAGAIVMYGITMLLASLSGVDATKTLTWDGGAPLALGAAAAIPAIGCIALLFLPNIKMGLTAEQLLKVSEVDQEEEADVTFTFNGSGFAGSPFVDEASDTDLVCRVLW